MRGDFRGMLLAMKTPASIPFACVAALALSSTLWAGDSELEKNLNQIAGNAAKQYVSPIVSGFGADFNAGWFHRAPKAKKFDLQIEGGSVFMASLLGNGKKHFATSEVFQMNKDAATELVAFVEESPDFAGMPAEARQAIKDSLIARLTGSEYKVSLEGATVIGDEKDTVKLAYGGGSFSINIPGSGEQTVVVPADTVPLKVAGILNGLPVLPLLAPQVTVGTVFGTNATFRWLPTVELTSEIGEMSYFGFGVQHNPGVWFGDPLPVDFSVGFFTQTFQVGELFEATSFAMGLNASKTLGWRFFNVTPYTGFMIEKSAMDFHYQRDIETDKGVTPVDVNFSVEGENTWRATFGLSLRLLILNLNADYNLGTYPSVSVGLMVGV